MVAIRSAKKALKRRWVAVNEHGQVIGQDHHSAKLSEADVDLIHDLRDAGLSYCEISKKFDDGVSVSKQMVMLICNGRRRCQTVMGHKTIGVFDPADEPISLNELDIQGGF